MQVTASQYLTYFSTSYKSNSLWFHWVQSRLFIVWKGHFNPVFQFTKKTLDKVLVCCSFTLGKTALLSKQREEPKYWVSHFVKYWPWPWLQWRWDAVTFRIVYASFWRWKVAKFISKVLDLPLTNTQKIGE